MYKKLFIFPILVTLFVVVVFSKTGSSQSSQPEVTSQDSVEENLGGINQDAHSLSINYLREKDYPGSNFIIEETLAPGSNYSRYLVSYLSEGLKIYALLTVPNGIKPKNGWPAIVFNHGYVPPREYRTTERYIAYVDGFARNGYIVLRSDYRGHGNSEGEAQGGYGSSDYTIDVLNGLSSLKRRDDVDLSNIGMWGHSMGGHITLRSMVVTKDIKAGVIWAGVVASYPDLISRWRRNTPMPQATPGPRRWRQVLVEQYGDPDKNPKFWDSISANSYLSEISGPVELHHGTSDSSVPVEFSKNLETELKSASQVVNYFEYLGDDHNISKNFSTAMSRSISFFDKYLKD